MTLSYSTFYIKLLSNSISFLETCDLFSVREKAKATACLTEAAAEDVEVVEELFSVEAAVLVEEVSLKEEIAVEVAENIVEGPSVVTEAVLIIFPFVTPHAGVTEGVEEDEGQLTPEVDVAVDVDAATRRYTSKISLTWQNLTNIP